MNLWNITLIFLVFFTTSCTPYGSKKDKVRPLKEYREYLTEKYEKRVLFEKDKKELQTPVLSMDDIWWYKEIQKKTNDNLAQVTLQDLYVKALRHSDQIKVFSDIPLIRETGIMEAKGVFDPIIFAEGGYNRLNVPTKNILEAGNNQQRLKEDEIYLEFGIRKRFAPGTQIEVKQKIQRIRNNSIFFDPNPQSVARFGVAVVQPFLRGAGVEYNTSVIRLAELDTEIAKNEFKRQMESHLLAITRAYWSLYLARVHVTLREKMYINIQNIYNEMKQRGNFDALQSEIYHTEAELALHKSQIIRLKTKLNNDQNRLFSLINAPEYKDVLKNVVLGDSPYAKWTDINVEKSIKRALYNRPEMEQVYLQIHAATVRLNMSKNELLPLLDGILEFSLSGIRADNDIGGALGDEFSEGNLSLQVGFEFEFPLPNRTARARHKRKQIEKRQLLEQFKTTAEGILFEVKLSVREVETTYQNFIAQQKAFIASKEEIDSLSKRRVLDSILEGGTAGFLQQLLAAQNHHLDTEFNLAKSLIDYNLAITNLKRSQGTFLSFEHVQQIKKQDENGLPTWKAILHTNKKEDYRIFRQENQEFYYKEKPEKPISKNKKN